MPYLLAVTSTWVEEYQKWIPPRLIYSRISVLGYSFPGSLRFNHSDFETGRSRNTAQGCTWLGKRRNHSLQDIKTGDSVLFKRKAARHL
jgi:hypothetical protein